MSDNPYPTTVLARALGSTSVALHGAMDGFEADDIAPRLALIELIAERGVSLPVSPATHIVVGTLAALVLAPLAIIGFFLWQSPALTAACGILLAAILSALWAFPPPVIVIDRRGIWIARRFRTDFCDWVALRSIDLRDLRNQGRMKVVLHFKPQAQKHHCAVYRGPVRMAARSIWKTYERLGGPAMAEFGAHPAGISTDEWHTALKWCLSEFGTPAEAEPPKRIARDSAVVIEESEFDDSEPT